MKDAKDGDLRVWWIPQIPGRPFHMPVESIEHGALLLHTLAQYDLFQLANRIKPDYCNAGGVEVFDSSMIVDGDCDGWIDWSPDEDDEHWCCDDALNWANEKKLMQRSLTWLQGSEEHARTRR